MLQNPQIKFEGLLNKGYLFPKYQGRFFAVKNQKTKQNKSNHSLSSPKPMKPLIYQHFPKQDYKEMKVQAQYMKKIQQLKKKLQRQICKYSKSQDKSIKLPNKFNLILEDEVNLLSSNKLRILHDQSLIDRLDTLGHQDRKSQLKKMRRKYAYRIHLKNNSEMRRRMKTDIDESSQSYRNIAETQFFTNRSSNSIKSKQSNHLPLIPKKQASPQSKHSFSISSSIRYSLPSRVFKSQTKKKIKYQQEYQMGPSTHKERQNESRVVTQNMKKYQPYDSINEHLKMKAMGIGMERKHNGFKSKKKQLNPRQTFLNGWDMPNDRQPDQINHYQ